ncbi:hypothetical protein KR038_002596, partial [Drosophila bunnanda]
VSNKSCLLAVLVTHSSADTSNPLATAANKGHTNLVEENPAPVAPFETSHKHPEAEAREEGFHTSHRISIRATDSADYSMNLLPTKERPELNPVLSALINEDVMKSIEAKRAIEEEELAEVRREIEEAAQAELSKKTSASTEAPAPQLTTLPTAAKKIDSLDEDVVMDPHEEFVNQNFALESAGSENSKKSRIEIKKGPNGQDYEYEYVYYYEEDDEPSSSKAEAPVETPEMRGKTRYTNIERSTPATPSENSLQSGKAKGRSSETAEDIEAERLPMITRFPSRGKNIEVPPTPALDSLETAAERKKISVKRPSLELVDSETFNTDEKQTKASRKGGESDLKPVIAIEQEQAAAAAEAALKQEKELELEKSKEEAPSSDQEEAEQTTPSMEKAALDLYAILTNENLNNEQTTAIADTEGSDDRFTTFATDSASTDEDDGLTTLTDQISSTSSSTSTTTTTTTTTTTSTEAPTTTTTTTTAAPSLYGGRRSGLSGLAGRNRFKLREGGVSTTTSTTEAPASTETTKTGRNRFSRPSIGGRSRLGARTTASPEAAPPAAPAGEEEVVAAKEVKPISSGFARGRPRNRFNLRGSTTTSTTERPSEEGGVERDSAAEAVLSSTTARSTLRGRPGLGLRGRSRTTTTKAPAAEGASGDSGSEGGSSSSEEGKAAAPAPAPAEPVRPSRFNLHRAGSNRLLPRGKLGRGATVTTEAPVETAAAAEDSAADSSSHHNDVKEEEGGEKEAASEGGDVHAPAGPVTGLNRLKTRPRLNALHKTDAAKSKAAAAPVPAPAPRKINPLLAKRRLHLAGATSTTEAPAEEAPSSSDGSAEQPAKEDAPGAGASDESGADGVAKSEQESATEAAESTTKQQARGLGLLGQRRRLPLRKPGTIL